MGTGATNIMFIHNTPRIEYTKGSPWTRTENSLFQSLFSSALTAEIKHVLHAVFSSLDIPSYQIPSQDFNFQLSCKLSFFCHGTGKIAQVEQSSPKCAINDTTFVAHRHREGLPHWELMG
jgi:hypothetical protein